MRNWKRRYFLLEENSMSYFKSDLVMKLAFLSYVTLSVNVFLCWYLRIGFIPHTANTQSSVQTCFIWILWNSLPLLHMSRHAFTSPSSSFLPHRYTLTVLRIRPHMPCPVPALIWHLYLFSWLSRTQTICLLYQMSRSRTRMEATC